MRAASGWTVLACAMLLPRLAAGDSDQSAMAETLFREGRRLMDDKRFDEGCPKLAESYRLDAATGTLLALALCHESQGRTASAWAEYTDAAGRARAEGNRDREQAAKDRAAALEPTLSRLTIRVAALAASIQGLVITRDGLAQAPATWGVAIPVDPGQHSIEASAPGREAFRLTLNVGASADRKQADVPVLAVQQAPTPVLATSSPVPAARTTHAPAARPADSSALRTTGWVLGGLGLIGLGIGSGFALHATSRNNDSKADCDGDTCGPKGFQDRTDAVASGNRATVGFIVGGVLLAGGLTLVLVGSPEKKGPALHAAPAAGWDGVGFVMKGRL